MGVLALFQRTFSRHGRDEEPSANAMPSRVISAAGASGSGRGARPHEPHPRRAPDAAPPPPPAGDVKPPRGSRETAALLRANGYSVLNEDKLRGNSRAVQPAGAAAQPAAGGSRAPQQPQRHVRIAEPAAAPARRPAADKRKQAEPSSSEEERPARASRSAAQQQPPSHHHHQQPGLKRVRSSWKMRPLLVDEKLAVFLEGQDDALLHYDGGEFYQWLEDCRSGTADPADGCPYPLVVQDKDLRTLLEIRRPEQQPAAELRQAAPAAAGGHSRGGILVPTVRLLPVQQQPDELVRDQGPPVVQRMQDSEQPDVAGTSAAALAASAAWRSAERAVALDPPYIRYVQPTPDDMDLAVEYDLDEEDEEWLEQYNEEAKRAKSRKARRTLGEEWMEHLIDRMEKEYTAELQRHPGKWVVQAQDPSSATGQPPAICIPSIDEVFPLDKCLQVPGINHYEVVIEAVYNYWRGKHRRAGRPLIQRLWYEPPWDRKKAAQRLASSAADGEGGGGGGADDGPFYAQDSPVALAGIRKRRMDPEEAKARFQEIRRDLESARTLADQARKREKLKKRELQLYKEEWAARMQAIHDGSTRVVLRQGRVKEPPAQLSTVWRMEAAGANLGPASSGELEEDQLLVGAAQDAAAQAEERAARLAMRRYGRDAGVPAPAGRPAQPQAHKAARPQPRPQQQQQQQRKAERPAPRPAPGLRAAASGGSAHPILHQGGNVRGPPAAPGVRRVPICVWCNSGDFLMLGCATCLRCFCFKCYQRRPGLGVNNWSRAVKDARYQCTLCRGPEAEDGSASSADELAAQDAADATTQRRHAAHQQQRRRGRPQQQAPTALASASRLEAERLGVEIPKGLGGAALRSFLVRVQRELEEEEEAEEGLDDGSISEQGERQQGQAQRAAPLKPSRQQPTQAQQQQQQAAQQRRRQHRRAASSSDSSGADGEERRPKQRKLGGAALASHMRRLEQRRQERELWQQGGGSDDDEQLISSSGGGNAGGEEEWPYTHIPAPPRKLGGAALKSYIKRQEQLLEEEEEEEEEAAGWDSEQPATSAHGDAPAAEAWPHAHIPPPPRKLGGAALKSYIKRQEQLLEEGDSEEAGAASHGKQPSSSSGAEEQGWPYTHIPPPARKLGGAALKSYIKRQEQLLEEEEEEEVQGGGGEPSGSSSGTAEEFGASTSEEEDATSGPAGGSGSSSSEEEEEEEEASEAKENREPPAKRQRKVLGGAALAAHLRKQEALAAATAVPAPGRRHPSKKEQARRLQTRH